MRKAGDKIDDKVLSKFPLGHVIEKMTKKDRKERYKFAENILEEIFDNHSIVRKYGEVETVVNFIQGVKNESIDSFFLHKRSEHNSRYNWKVDAFYNGIEKKFGKDYIKKLKDLEKKIKRGEAFQKGDIGLGCVSAGFGAITWFGAMGWVLNGSNPHVVYGIPLTLMLISVITGERRTSSKNIEAGKNLEKNLLEMYKMRSDIARKVEPEIDEKNLEGMQNYFNKYNTFIENQKTQQVIDPEIEAEFQEVRKQIAYVKANAGKEKQLQVQEIEQIKLDKIKEKEDKKKEKEFEEAAIIRKEYEDSKKPHIEL